MIGMEATQAPTHDISLFDFQSDVFHSTSRFRVVAAGRRTGKSFLGCVEAVFEATSNPGCRVIVVSPTFTMAKEAFWSNLKVVINRQWTKKVSESNLEITFLNGSRISLKSADNPDSLRGISPSPSLVILDEWAFAPQNAFQEVIMPMLSDPTTRGKLFAISTPKGVGSDFYVLWENGQRQDMGDWASWQFAAEDVRPDMREEIQLAKNTLDVRTFDQEFRASWINAGHVVFPDFNRQIHVLDDIDPPMMGEAIHICIDFNVSIMAASVFCLRGDQLHFFHEFQGAANTSELIDEIKREFPNRQIYVYPDPSGNARKTSSPTGQTDISLLRHAGFGVRVRKSHPTIKDSVNAVNRLLKDANGNSRMFFQKNGCPETIRSVEATSWIEKRNSQDLDSATIDKSQGIEHFSDGVRYACEYLFPVTNSGRAVVRGRNF